MVWRIFMRLFRCIGRNQKNRAVHLVNRLSINEEYMAAHRTNSYMEMLDKVEAQPRRSLDRLTSPYSVPLQTNLSEHLLGPQQETLISMIQGSNLHPLIVSYFEDSFEACNTSEILLRSVHQVRANHKIIQGVIKLTNGIKGDRSCPNARFRVIFEELASFSELNNPLMTVKPAQFRDIHNTHGHLLCRLTTKLRNIRRKAKLKEHCIFPAPEVRACSFGLVRRNKLKIQGLQTGLNERLGPQLDVASKGVFIMINEFDTMGRLVKRLQDDIEHFKAIASMCVTNGKLEVLIEVVKEIQIHQTCFLDQLEELEEHIYLCFLTINRSRMLVMQEITVLQED